MLLTLTFRYYITKDASTPELDAERPASVTLSLQIKRHCRSQIARTLRLGARFVWFRYCRSIEMPLSMSLSRGMGLYIPGRLDGELAVFQSEQFHRHVAENYDPAGVFQRLTPGGFKISRVV